MDPDNVKSIQNIIGNIDVPIKIVITHDYNDSYISKFDSIIDFSKMSIDSNVK
ncbi:MAG TPA: hypothetical protein VK087_04935 [Tissierellaceae bacterium]|nr:hypothetical protein [Tissierellaceae bacterium]